MSEATGSPVRGVFGKSEVVQDGTIDGMPRLVMRPKSLPYVEVEVIDGCGNVDIQRTGHADRYWREQLEGQGGDPVQRAVDGRMNANRVVVAICSGPGSFSGERLQAERRKHGYQVSSDRRGRKFIEIIDENSEIANRRRDHAEQLQKARIARVSEKMDTAIAASSVVLRQSGGLAAAPVPAAQSAELEAMRARMAEMEAMLAKATGPASPIVDLPATIAALDDDTPADRPARKGK